MKLVCLSPVVQISKGQKKISGFTKRIKWRQTGDARGSEMKGENLLSLRADPGLQSKPNLELDTNLKMQTNVCII